MAVKDYLRERFFPHMWCAGCGHGIVLGGLIRAIEKLGMSKNEIVMCPVSGALQGYPAIAIFTRCTPFTAGRWPLPPA
jgi:pyruvate/2-oxoacid:ferredoxin oxidoreductase beta subunit